MVQSYAKSWLPRLFTFWDDQRVEARPPLVESLAPGEPLLTEHVLDRALEQLRILRNLAQANGLVVPSHLMRDPRPITLARLPTEILVDIIKRVIYRPEPLATGFHSEAMSVFRPFRRSPGLMKIAYQQFYRVNSMYFGVHDLVDMYNTRYSSGFFTGKDFATDTVEIIDLHFQLPRGLQPDKLVLEAKAWLLQFHELLFSFVPKLKLVRLHFSHAVQESEEVMYMEAPWDCPNNDGFLHDNCRDGNGCRWRRDEPGTRSLMDWLYRNYLYRVEWYAEPRKTLSDCGHHELLSFDLSLDNGKELRCELVRCIAM